MLNQAPAIRYNQASIKLVDYVIKRGSDWFPGKYEKVSEVERFKSVIRTDQGEFFTRAFTESAVLLLRDLNLDQYWSEIIKEDPTWVLPKQRKPWDQLEEIEKEQRLQKMRRQSELDWVSLSVRANTLGKDPLSLSLFQFAIIPLKKRVGKGERKERIIRAFKHPSGNFRFYRHEEDPKHPDYMVWPLRGVARLPDPARCDGYPPQVSRSYSNGIPGHLLLRPRCETRVFWKDPIFSLALQLDLGESRLLPCKRDEELESQIEEVNERELLTVTIGTQGNLTRGGEYWSDND